MRKNMNSRNSLSNEDMVIRIDDNEIVGKTIVIAKNIGSERDSIIIRVSDGEQYSMGELVITDKMHVFYNHKKRSAEEHHAA